MEIRPSNTRTDQRTLVEPNLADRSVGEESMDHKVVSVHVHTMDN